MLELVPIGDGLRSSWQKVAYDCGQPAQQASPGHNSFQRANAGRCLSLMNKVDFATKRTLLGEALVKDPSRSKVDDVKLGVGGKAMEPMSYHVMSHELMSLGLWP